MRQLRRPGSRAGPVLLDGLLDRVPALRNVLAAYDWAPQVPMLFANRRGIAHVWNMCSLPVFFIYRGGTGICVRPHRYALARRLSVPLGPDELGLHECDMPLCVKHRHSQLGSSGIRRLLGVARHR